MKARRGGTAVAAKAVDTASSLGSVVLLFGFIWMAFDTVHVAAAMRRSPHPAYSKIPLPYPSSIRRNAAEGPRLPPHLRHREMEIRAPAKCTDSCTKFDDGNTYGGV